MAERQLLGDAPAQRGGQLVHQLLARGNLPLLGQVPGGAQRLAARDDRHLDKGAGVFQNPAHGGVAGFVVGDGPLLLVGDYLVLALQPADDAVNGGQEILLADEFLVVTRGYQRRFIADVGNVGARESGGLPRQETAVERRIELERPQVDLENLLALAHVGQPDLYLTVETPGTHQRLVQDVGTVRRREDDHPGVGLEAVHLGEQLVERVLALVVAREPGILAAGPADGVDFVDEDDAGGFLLGLLEKVADSRRPHPDEHFDEVGARNREERHIGLPGHGFGQQGLTRSRRTHKQRPFRYLGTQLLVFVGFLEEVDDFHDFDLGFLQPGHVLESNGPRIVLVENLRPGLAHVHDAAARTASGTAQHGTHQEEPHGDNEHPRQQVDQNAGPLARTGFVDHRNGVSRRLFDGAQVLAERIDRRNGEGQMRPLHGQPTVQLDRIGPVTVGGCFRQEDLGLVAVDDPDFLDLALADHPFDSRPLRRQRRVAALAEKVPPEDGRPDHSVDPPDRRTRQPRRSLFMLIVLLCHNLFFVLVTGQRSVGPQLFQPIEFAQLGLENVHHHVHIVHGNPHGRLLPLDAPDLFAQLLLHLLLDAVGDGRDLRRRIGVADHERRTDGPVETREVQRYNILTLFIFNRADDRPDEFLHKIMRNIYNLAKIRISESKSKFTCILPSVSIFCKDTKSREQKQTIV